MGLDPDGFGFHAFRRSGACLAFDQRVPIEKIKLHGHWLVRPYGLTFPLTLRRLLQWLLLSKTVFDYYLLLCVWLGLFTFYVNFLHFLF